MATAQRGNALTVFAVLFSILAISNLLKPFQFGGEGTAFVFLGQRTSGLLNTVLGPLFGVFLAVYAYGIWNMKRFAMPMAHAYATYVVLNLVLWSLRGPHGDDLPVWGAALYAVVAIGVSATAAVLLTQRKADLT